MKGLRARRAVMWTVMAGLAPAIGSCHEARQYHPLPDASDAGLDTGLQGLDTSAGLDHAVGSDVPTDAANGDDSSAVPACPAGKHMCPGGCVAGDDVRTCGTSCTPCQAPTDGIEASETQSALHVQQLI